MIESFNIKSERCSGSNYLQKLIETNLGIKYIQNETTGWKHGYYSVFRPGQEFEHKFLTIILFRDAIDWLRSFYLNPHHLIGSTFGGRWKKPEPSFSEFLRMEMRQFNVDKKCEIHMERHPYYLRYPKDIFELRKWKIEHFLCLKNKLPNTFYVNYEELEADPEKIISEINSRWFNVDYEFKNWNMRKHSNVPYVKNNYFKINRNDYLYICDNVDWNLEKSIGYLRPSNQLEFSY